ncbi:glycosyltransferase [Geomonas nitrogeniifigens]|uniref:Glycosyltransferase n=1 Tax=Geomonas diazotrophica TaxID=2843197 RepID=A0ABX8JE23_9BACT|nr:glycosyltransferase [Geomonas nitrogeniifigens]QWV95849.1 glycosyltransferase [Geomonas nitrogeniifigens]QXE84934.1 glycosyltransferase [Geomonas nitrogeniifigens]
MVDYGLVSIVTATYNMAQYLPLTVESVLGQTYQNLELIVVDDGSSDDTSEVMARFAAEPRVRYIRLERNCGQTVAKNRGLSEVKGAFVAFVDADNLWKPNKLERQLPLFVASERTGVVYSDAEYIDGSGAVLPYIERKYHDGDITAKLLLSNFVNFNSAVVRKEVIDEVGGFDEALAMGIDWDLWLRISVRYRFRFLPEQTYSYRLWENQMSHQKVKRLKNAEKILEKFQRAYPDAVPAKTLDEAKALLYADYALLELKNGTKSEAMTQAVRALKMRPDRLQFWKTLIKVIIG